MNKYLLLLVLTTFFSTVCAQNFTITPNPAFAEANLDEPLTDPADMVAEALISNNTSDTLFLRWDRIVNDRPDGWEISVSDPDIHLLPHVNNKDFILLPNTSEQAISVHAYPGGMPCCLEETGAIPGEGEVHLKISNLNDPSDTLTAVYNFTLIGSPILDLTELELEQINIFPNPASSYFTLSETKEIDRIVVYNILGNLAKAFVVNGNRLFEINDLPNGSYLIRLFSNDQQILKTLHLQKQ